MKTKLIMTLAAGFVLAAGAQAQSIIDSFETWQFAKVGYCPCASNCVSTSAPEALGGERDLGVGRLEGSAMDSLFGDVCLTFPCTASLSCGPGVLGCMHISYDGFDNSIAINPTGLGGVDLTEGGACNAFVLLTTSDLGANVDVTVYQDATHYSFAEIAIAADPTFTFAETVLPFAQFVPIGPEGGADFTQVGALDFVLCNGPAGADIGMGVIRTAHDGSPRSRGFWTNHEALWPTDSLVLGAWTYGKAELLTLLTTPVRGDASMSLAQQLIAAKLNLAAGAAPEPIADAIAEADALLAQFTGPLPYKVTSRSALSAPMLDTAATLEAWNTSAE